LAVLNACEGARSGRTDPFAGTAQSLVQQGIPAVLAMQFEITDEAAIVFSQVLYEAVSDGYPLDAATAEARKAVHAGPNPVEWATPVLYLRTPDGRIFDLVTTPNPLGAASGAPTLDAAQLGAQSAPDQSTSVQPPAPTPRTSPTADRDVQDAHSASQPTAPGPLTDPW
jgi:hypothetical protein